MKTLIISAGVTLLCLAGAAGAQEEPQVQLGARDVVAARKAGMNLSGATMASIKATIDAGGPVRGQAFAAGGLMRWGRALPGLFPAGTGQGDLGEDATDARAEIWANRADFDAKAQAFTDAATRLSELARADDAAGFATQWTEVRAACQSCHTAYKAE